MAAKLKTGFYQGLHAEPHYMWVLKENADKTVDVGTEDGTLIVGKCPLSPTAKPGHFTLGKMPDGAPVEAQEAETTEEKV